MHQTPDTRAYAEDRRAWLEARRQGIGASDAAVIVCPEFTRKSQLELYSEKLGLVVQNDEETEAMEWGHLLEPVIADKYERETGRSTYDPGDFHIDRNPDAPWMFATLDRVVNAVTIPPERAPIGGLLPPVLNVPGVLELKNASAFKKADWKDEPPLPFQVQVQHQMAVTGHLWGSIAVLIGGNAFLWTDIPRNDEFISRLMLAEDAFWTRILRKLPPEPDASESAKKALIALYPEAARDHVALGHVARELDERRLAAKAAIKQHESTIDECENKLKALIGVHAAGVLPNGAVYQWKNRKREAYTVKASEWRQLDRVPREGAPKR